MYDVVPDAENTFPKRFRRIFERLIISTPNKMLSDDLCDCCIAIVQHAITVIRKYYNDYV